MTIHVGVSGAHKTVTSAYVGVSGTWKRVLGKWVGVGGVWKKYFGDVVDIPLSSVTHITSGTATAGFRFKSDGVTERIQGGTSTGVGNWVTPGASAGNYEARATLLSGTFGDGDDNGTLNSWLALTSTRVWSITQIGGGNEQQCTLTVEIRRASDQVVVDTQDIALTATVLL